MAVRVAMVSMAQASSDQWSIDFFVIAKLLAALTLLDFVPVRLEDAHNKILEGCKNNDRAGPDNIHPQVR